MVRIILLSIVLAAGACALPAEREAERIKAAMAATSDQARQCRAQIGQSSEWQELSADLPPLDGSEPSMSLRINNDIPTAAQASRLVTLFNERLEPCQALIVASLHKAHSSLAVVAAGSNAAANQAYARLAARQITWGAYAGLSATLTAEARANWAKAAQRLDAELDARLDAEHRQRQAAIINAYSVLATQTTLNQNAVALNQNQQLINAANRPRMVNCTRMAGYLSCTQF